MGGNSFGTTSRKARCLTGFITTYKYLPALRFFPFWPSLLPLRLIAHFGRVQTNPPYYSLRLSLLCWDECLSGIIFLNISLQWPIGLWQFLILPQNGASFW